MALIPLESIPNAPQLSNPVPIPQVGANTNLTGSLGPMQQQKMSLDSFSGKARGLEVLGDAGPKVAAVFSDISSAISHANDVAGSAKATNIMNSAYTNHMADMQSQGVPPDQWGQKWTDVSLPKAQDEISKIKVSPRAAEGLNAQVSMWGQSATSKINLAGVTQHIENGKADLLGAINNAYDSGNMEAVPGLIQSGTDAHFWDTVAGKNMLDGYKEKQLTQHVYADMNAHPRQAADELEAAKSGDPEAIAKLPYPYNEAAKGDATKLANYAYQARRIAGVTASDTLNDIIGGVNSGDIKTKEDIDAINKAKGGIFSEAQLKQAYGALSLNVPYVAGKAASLHNDIVNANPDQDFDMSKKMDLLNRISTEIPPQLRPTYSEMINKAYNPTPDTKIPTLIKQGNFAQVQDWKKAGLLGPTGMDGTTVSTKPEDVISYNKLANREVDYQVAFEQAQESGGVKTPEEAEAFTQKFWSPEIQANAAKVKANTEPSKFEKLFGAPSAPVPYAPADAQKAIDNGLPKATPGALPESNPQASNTTDPVEFVKSVEGFTAKASPDYKQTSVGYGTRAKNVNEVLTESEATQRLKEELSMHESRIDEAITSSGMDLTPAQRTALISFDFNTGEGANLLETSDSLDEVAKRMAKYTKVTVDGKKVENKGLVNRRAAELKLFNS